MFNKEEFKQNAYTVIDWIADYFEDVEKIPVRSNVGYGDIKKQLPEQPPVKSESITEIFDDFQQIIMPGITHWQSPRYFAYFPANSSEPSVLAEFLTAALGVQGMKWITSPAATELEEVIMSWLRQMIGLPEKYTGVIQDSASVSTLCAILAAREKITRFASNSKGLNNNKLRVYCSSEAHSSIEKALRIAGLGSENLVKINVDSENRMIPQLLETMIEDDITHGYTPACVVAALGTTGTGAIDPIGEIGHIAKKRGIWLHVDAAFAGTALILPEFRSTIHGFHQADSLVFNPHKWMFTNFDCSAFFVKDKEHLQNVFRLVPVYLQTQNNTEANDYSNWGIQLGRRFRSLKLWFVIRNFGLEGIQQRLRDHIKLAEYFEKMIVSRSDFELIVPRNLAIVCFRFKPAFYPELELNELNSVLLEKINETGKAYLSHTVVGKKFTLRFVCAQTHTEKIHVEEALETIFNCAKEIVKDV
jgi:aromatic-L-amino-acid/L-tryptophan decarboxylase